MKHLMSGNEATARGVYEAGIKICSAYPGTPSTEILENLPQYKDDVYCEWAPNEKVATEVAYGASIAGSRSFCTMKMVGLNVAADPLFTAGYMGVGGAFIVVTADDPSCHSSQNEQDNRHYARAAKIAMVEPSDAQECKDFVALACEVSERLHPGPRLCQPSHCRGAPEEAGGIRLHPCPGKRPEQAGNGRRQGGRGHLLHRL